MNNSYSIDGLLHDAQVAIDNALSNPDILNALSDFGYTAERIQQGKALYTTALAAQTTQQMEAGEQKSATAELEANRAVANTTYMRFVKVARVAFKRDVGITAQLDSGGNRKRSLTAKGVKSLSHETMQTASNFPPCSRSIASRTHHT